MPVGVLLVGESKRLSHLDESGKARMVDVGAKADSERVAIARGVVRMRAETLALIREGGIAKGDVRAAAELAGVMGAKRTADLIPLCHPLALTQVVVSVDIDGATVSADGMAEVVITATAKTVGKTGVEMEALTAVCVAALTVYDMCKAVDRGMRIADVRLVHKSGGRSGTWDARDV
ncbi:MAG: cyclic pyranopterin monophosphate synthase MoaC [Anaerolineae bacterium]